MKTTIGTDLIKAKEILEANDIIGVPTETVYGLAANGLNDKAILKLYQIKNRPLSNPLTLQTSSISKALDFVELFPNKALLLAKAFWPGPLTLLLKKKNVIPDIVTSGKNTVGIRIPNHQLTLQLLDKLSFPLAVPSANIYGNISATNPKNIVLQFGNKLKYILDGGDSLKGIESTIVGFENNQTIIYRLGAISKEDIEETIQSKVIIEDSLHQKTQYNTKTPLQILKSKDSLYNLSNNQYGIIHFDTNAIPSVPLKNQIWLTKSSDLNEAAKNLYNAILKLDEMNLKGIYILPFPDQNIGKNLNYIIHKFIAKN